MPVGSTQIHAGVWRGAVAAIAATHAVQIGLLPPSGGSLTSQDRRQAETQNDLPPVFRSARGARAIFAIAFSTVFGGVAQRETAARRRGYPAIPIRAPPC